MPWTLGMPTRPGHLRSGGPRRPTVTLAIDGTPTSEPAIRWAAERATRRGLALQIVAVATDDGPLRRLAADAVESAARLVSHLSPGAVTRTEILSGNVFDALVAASAQADLLVVGASGGSPVTAALHAALPMRLAGRVACPLAVIPADWAPGSATTGVVVGWSAEHPSSADALEFAAREAEETGAQLTIVHAWRPMPTSAYDADFAGELLAVVQEDAHVELLDARRIVGRDHPGLAVTTELHAGDPVAGLLHAARDAALVVAGTHQRSMLSEIVFGSTGDALMRASRTTPVVVVPHRDPARRLRRGERAEFAH